MFGAPPVAPIRSWQLAANKMAEADEGASGRTYRPAETGMAKCAAVPKPVRIISLPRTAPRLSCLTTLLHRRTHFGRYFFAMLDDRDRNARYNEAIRACIADFREEQGRAPRVLDVGVGTGYLSQCCLLAGAEHVTGVDVNENMVAQAERNLAQVDRTGERFTVELVRRGKSPFEGKDLFDIIVSEILGTLAMSENMCKYLSLYAQHLRTFGAERRVYMVPCETRQHFTLRAWDRDELGEPLGSLLRSAVEHEAR